ncbi:MAG: aminodeoxychorismate synthase component I [Verrucomicrobiia bacterium]
MKTIVKQIPSPPDLLVMANEKLLNEQGSILLLSALPSHPYSRYSFLCRKPFLEFRSDGSICEITSGFKTIRLYGNPWLVLDDLLQRYELLNEIDLPFPVGGAFGFWGYDLKNHIEKCITTKAKKDIDTPDCDVLFYDSLLVYDHLLNKMWIISTGMNADGTRNLELAKQKVDEWMKLIEINACESKIEFIRKSVEPPTDVFSNMTRSDFISAVNKAKKYIYSGDIYQVNLSHRIEATFNKINPFSAFLNLLATSPAPFAAYFNFGDYQLFSSSPELFLKLTGRHIITRPIKGTRPRGVNHQQDIQMEYELKTSQKEIAELIMITDLLRNDLGKICQYGSVQVDELLKCEPHPHIFHLVSTIQGELKPDLSHTQALAACFPGGSITGAPKIRAMQIIDELEPTARGVYTGAHGYVGFNKESQLSITIRTAICKDKKIWFQTGAGIVADSIPEAEYDETMAKAKGFLLSIGAISNKNFVLKNESIH